MKLRPLALVSFCCALLALYLRAPLPSGQADESPSALPAGEPRTPLEYRRDPQNTFLTFPEWFLVYSPDEYAHFIGDKPPSQFPYFGHIGQFWQGYRAMYDVTKDRYPFNSEYHVMVMVIGTSTTVEYGAKGGYEVIVGRVAEATRRHGLTAEDQLAAKVAREYVDFLDVEPWYRFDFVTPLKKLWGDAGWWGPDPIRKWERKYFLTSEYAAKAAYGWLIKQMTESAYGIESPVTAVVIDHLPDAARKELPALKVLQEFPDGAVLVELPRYQAFSKHARILAGYNVKFLEIAGNQDRIQISALVPADFDDTGFQMVMKQPILTQPGLQRLVYTVTVPEFAAVLRKLEPPLRLEHVYDY